MRRLEVSGAVRSLYGSLGVKGLSLTLCPAITQACAAVSGVEPSVAVTCRMVWRRDCLSSERLLK